MDHASSKHVLLLTATITPPMGVPSLVRVDPSRRREDYLQAFRFYLGLLGQPLDRIVFAENSASDLGDFEALARERGAADQVEFVSFYGLDYPVENGRAFGEFTLFDHVAMHSQTWRTLGEDHIMWKMTGRYMVRNLPRIIAARPKEFDLYCNLRNYPMPWADMYLMAWTRRGFDEILKGLAPQLRERKGQAPEVTFRRIIDEARRTHKVAPRLYPIPIIDGVRGYDNKHYTKGDSRIKVEVRRLARVLAPWFWI